MVRCRYLGNLLVKDMEFCQTIISQCEEMGGSYRLEVMVFY